VVLYGRNTASYKFALATVRHTLRHTAITHLVQAGVDLPTVKRISGHKNLSMVERYSHQNGSHIQAAMDKLSERYKSKIS
jgi:site-specific recombinase XerD